VPVFCKKSTQLSVDAPHSTAGVLNFLSDGYKLTMKGGNAMDQAKIGSFIAQRRKLEKLTQLQLAEKLGITDRAVSKWETGKSMPDASIMLELCSILKITVNDLLHGEVVTVEDYKKELENSQLEMVRQKEAADKRLLALEIWIGVLALAAYLAVVLTVAFSNIQESTQMLIILPSTVFLVLMAMALVRIEQVAGYYKCGKCGHRAVPTYMQTTMAPHIGRTRYMRCPECGKLSWQKKVISKE
jgi:transcriptional regulator with XRE-family HTH domain/DNA-directed RNA polymerase subunit RPC12/RpoP